MLQIISGKFFEDGIETICPIRAYRLTIVTPFVGVWIETPPDGGEEDEARVTPFVGVWIETMNDISDETDHDGHTLRGCVD